MDVPNRYKMDFSQEGFGGNDTAVEDEDDFL